MNFFMKASLQERYNRFTLYTLNFKYYENPSC